MWNSIKSDIWYPRMIVWFFLISICLFSRCPKFYLHLLNLFFLWTFLFSVPLFSIFITSYSFIIAVFYFFFSNLCTSFHLPKFCCHLLLALVLSLVLYLCWAPSFLFSAAVLVRLHDRVETSTVCTVQLEVSHNWSLLSEIKKLKAVNSCIGRRVQYWRVVEK